MKVIERTLVLITILLFSIQVELSYAEEHYYLFDNVNKFVCLRTSENMDIDLNCGIYPSGTEVSVLECIEDKNISDSKKKIVKVEIGGQMGWVLQEEISNLKDAEYSKIKVKLKSVDMGAGIIKPQLYPKVNTFNDAEILEEDAFAMLIGYYSSMGHIRINNDNKFCPWTNIFLEDYEFWDKGDYRPNEVLNLVEIWISGIKKYKGLTPNERWTNFEIELLGW